MSSLLCPVLYDHVVLGNGEESMVITETSAGVVRRSCDPTVHFPHPY